MTLLQKLLRQTLAGKYRTSGCVRFGVLIAVALMAIAGSARPSDTGLDDPATWLATSDTVCSLIGRQFLDSALVRLPEVLARAQSAIDRLDTTFERVTMMPMHFEYNSRYYVDHTAKLVEKIRQLDAFGDTESPEYFELSIELAELYRHDNRGAEAMAILDRIDQPLSALDLQHPQLSAYWHRVRGALYEDNCEFREAEVHHSKAVSLTEGRDGLALEHARSLSSLGRVNFIIGNFGLAEFQLRTALYQLEGMEEISRVDCVNLLSTLVTLLSNTSRHEYAGVLNIRMLNYAQQAPDIAPLHLSRALSASGTLMRRIGRYVEAEIYFRMAHKVDENAFGPMHPATGVDVLRMGILYWGTKRLTEARTHIDSSIVNFRKTLPSGHLEFSSAYMFQASILDYANMPDSAGILYRLGVENRERHLGKVHPRTLDTKEFYAGHLSATGGEAKAISIFSEIFDSKIDDYLHNAIALELSEGSQYLTEVRECVANYLQGYFSLKSPSNGESQRAVEMILKTKGLVLHEEMLRRQSLRDNSNGDLDALIDESAIVEGAMVKLRFDDPTFLKWESIRRLDSLQCRSRLLALQMEQFNTPGRRRALVDEISIANVCAGIPDGAVLVDYYEYLHYFPVIRDSAEQRYVSVVLDRNGIRMIATTTGGNQDDSLTVIGAELLAQSGPGEQSSERLRSILRSLYDRFWKPIDSAIGQADLVLVAPDHMLSALPFHAFLDNNDKFLIERYPFSYLTTGRDLLIKRGQYKSNNGLLAVGDADYDATPESRFGVLSGEEVDQHFARVSVRSDFRNFTVECTPFVQTDVSRIEGTKTEIDNVTKIWKSLIDEPFLRFSGAAASEDICRTYADRSRVIHFATHGYFLPRSCNVDTKGNRIHTVMLQGKLDVLVNSGVLLAGSNLHGQGAEKFNVEDGILTAGEAAELDLEGVDLVVLSSCESAQGAPFQGQGQWGIRQSFWSAGAKSVVSAFWAIPDALTAEFMERLYSKPHIPLPKLLRTLALEDISALRSAGQFPAPFYWGSFHNFGDWRTTIAGN